MTGRDMVNEALWTLGVQASRSVDKDAGKAITLLHFIPNLQVRFH